MLGSVVKEMFDVTNLSFSFSFAARLSVTLSTQ